MPENHTVTKYKAIAEASKTPGSSPIVAKNYKTLEEFLKAHGTPVYHGTSQDFKVFDKSKLGSYSGARDAIIGFHFTDNKKIADLFGIPEQTKEVFLDIKKLFDPYDFIGHENKYPELYEIIFGKSPEINSESYDEFSSIMGDALAWNHSEFKQEFLNKDILNRLKAKGYDGIKFPLTESDVLMGKEAGVKNIRGNEIIVFEPSQIKTKSQLIDIWNNANKSPIVYHGTFAEFKKFDKGMLGSFTGAPSAHEGFFFATNRKVAVSYASDLTKRLREYGTKADLARKEIERITGDSYFTALHKTYLHSYPPDIDKKVFELNDIILKYEDLEAGVESIPMGYDYELDPSGRLIKARLDLKKPFIYDMKGEDYRAVSYYDLIKKAKSGGYDGLIIKNTYDGANPVGNLIMTDIYVAFDESQIKIINKKAPKAELMIREGGTPAAAPDVNEIVNRIVQEIKEKPWTVPQKRAEIVARLKSASDEIDRKIITEIRSFRPRGTLSELGAAMGAEPRKGVRIDTIMGATVFDEKKVPSKERVARWDADHKTAEIIRGIVPEYAFALDARPNTVTGNYRVVERAQRLKEQGLLSPEEENVLDALEKYWQAHPDFDRKEGYGVWAYNLEIMVPERLKVKTTSKQPWQMTKHEAIQEAAKPLGPMGISWGEMRTALSTSRQSAESLHKDMVKLAIVEGKPVPAEVLKEYPDLTAKIKEPWQMRQYEYLHATAILLNGEIAELRDKTTPSGKKVKAFELSGDVWYSQEAGDHRYLVKKALTEGKPVPPEVLKDYPGLTTEKKQPWEMSYSEFADFFEDVYGGQKFSFAERVGKPIGIMSQSGEPYRLIKGRKIGYSGSLPRDRWRLAIVDRALSEGKKVPEDVIAELSESLKHEKEKLGGTGMAEQPGNLYTVKVYELIGVPRPVRELRKVHDNVTLEKVKEIVESSPNYDYDIFDSRGDQIQFIKLFGRSPDYTAWSKKIDEERKRLEMERMPPGHGAISGGTPARQILSVTEPEGYYFGTQVEVMQGVDPELEPYFSGTVKRLLNNGELVEVHPEGEPMQVSFRVPVDRVNVTRLVTQEAPKKLYRYYFRNRPPDIGTYPQGAVMKEAWLPMRKTPKGNMAFGWVSYERELTPDEIKNYELFVDETVMPKLVAEFVKYVHDEGIQAGYKEFRSEYGKAFIDWLKANNEWKPDKGEEAEFLRHMARLTGIRTPEKKIEWQMPTKEAGYMPTQEDYEKAKLFISALSRFTLDELIQQEATVRRWSIRFPELEKELEDEYKTYLELRQAEKATAEAARKEKASKPQSEQAKELYKQMRKTNSVRELDDWRNKVLFEAHLPDVEEDILLRDLAAKWRIYLETRGVPALVALTKLPVDYANEDYYFSTEVWIHPTTPIFNDQPLKGRLRHALNGGELFEVAIEGREGTQRIQIDRIYVTKVIEKDRIKPEQAIKIAADSINELRRVDIYRVLNQYKENSVEIGNYIKSNRPDLIAEVDKILGEFQPKDKFAEMAWQMTSKEFINEALKLNKYREKYEKDPQLMDMFTKSEIQKWKELVEKHGEIGKLPDKVIEDYIKLFGEQALFSVFRGTKAKGIEGWRIPAETPDQLYAKLFSEWNPVSKGAQAKVSDKDMIDYISTQLEIPPEQASKLSWIFKQKLQDDYNEAMSKAKAEKEIKKAEEDKQAKADELKFWNEVKDLKVVDFEVQHEINPDRPTRTYFHVYDRTFAILENGKKVQVDRTIYKGVEGKHALKSTKEFYAQIYNQYMGKPLSEWITYEHLIQGNRYENYKAQQPKTRFTFIPEAPPTTHMVVSKPEIPVLDLWAIVKDMKMIDFDFQKESKPDVIKGRTYQRTYVITFAVLENGKKIQVKHTVYEGESAKRILKLYPSEFRREWLELYKEYIGKPLSAVINENELYKLNLIENYIKQAPLFTEVQPSITLPPVAKPVQSMQDVKQQTLSSIQAAGTVEELQPILKGIGFLPLSGPEKRQVMDAYQNKYSTLMSERPFGAPVQVEKKAATATPQQLFEAEQRRKLEEARRVSVTPTLTGGAVTAKRLEMFEPGAMEKAKAEADARKRIEQLGLPYEVHPYIKKLASGTQDVMKFGTKRGKETLEDLVLTRYVRFCPPGTIIDNRSFPKVPERWWVYPPKLRACMGEIEKKVAAAGAVQECMIRENIQPAMTESMRSYIRGAQAVRDVIHYYRDGRPPIRGVLYRARDRTYFVEAQDGQVYASMGWVDIEAQQPYIMEPAKYAGARA